MTDDKKRIAELEALLAGVKAEVEPMVADFLLGPDDYDNGWNRGRQRMAGGLLYGILSGPEALAVGSINGAADDNGKPIIVYPLPDGAEIDARYTVVILPAGDGERGRG